MTKKMMTRRMRRNRRSPSIRALVEETHVNVTDLIQPLFVKESLDAPEPVLSMPGVYRLDIQHLVKVCCDVSKAGIPAVALFPCFEPGVKDDEGSHALNPDQLLFRAIREVKQAAPSLTVITDVALDPYTRHGHDGVLNAQGTDVDNDSTVDRLCQLAVLEARAGADWVAPSDMMDGRVAAIRRALDENGFTETGILSYAAKFASSFYGPFRDAVGSAQAAGAGPLDKRTYQMNPANVREALLDALLDEQEGADVLMVKPAGPYLDILARLRERTLLPLAAYQVSGEYAQLHAAAERGWLDLKKTRDESLLAIKRAGADMILTYFALDFARDQA